VPPRRQQQVLPRGQGGEERLVVQHLRHGPAERRLPLVDRVRAEAHRAGERRQQPDEGLQHRRLARPVGPDERDGAARRHPERHGRAHLHVAVPRRDRVGAQQGIGLHRSACHRLQPRSPGGALRRVHFGAAG
jgi:hypothetical protein